MSIQDSTEALAQRILESVLRQLENGAGQPAPASLVDQISNGAGSPVIIILPGGSQALSIESSRTNHSAALPLAVTQSDCGCQNNSHTVSKNSVQSPHPGLERFDLPEENAVQTAPRRCFIEPDRVCIGSGACKMRGY